MINFFKNRDIKNGYYATIDFAISPILMIVLTPILLKYLGVENYGLWALINSLISSLAIFNFGINHIIIKYVSLYVKESKFHKIKSTYSSVFLFQLAVAITIFFILLFSYQFIIPYFNLSADNHFFIEPLFFAVPLFFFKQFEQSLYAFLKAHEDFKNVAVFSLFSKLLFFGSQGFVAYYTSSVAQVFKFALLITLLSYFFQVLILKLRFSYISFFSNGSFSELKIVYNYGFWNWLSSVVSILTVHIDKWMVTSFLGLKIFGYYSIGILIFNQMHSVISSSISWIFPLLSSKERGSIYLNKKFYNLLTYVVLVSLIISIILINFDYIFVLWLGDEVFENSFYFVKLFLIILPLYTLSCIPYYYLLALGFVKDKFIVNATVLVIKLVVIYIALVYFESELWPLSFLIFLIYENFAYSRILKQKIKLRVNIFYFVIVSLLILIYFRTLLVF